LSHLGHFRELEEVQRVRGGLNQTGKEKKRQTRTFSGKPGCLNNLPVQ
jgi:hypothetical protein